MTFRWHCISQPVLRLAEKMTKKIGKNVCRDLETCTSSSRSTLTKPKFTAIGMVEVVTVYCTFSTFDRPFRISMVISLFSIITCEIFCLTQFAQLSKDLKSSRYPGESSSSRFPGNLCVFESLITGSPQITVTFSECECNAHIHRQASLEIQPTSSTTSMSRVGSGRTAKLKKLTNRQRFCSLDVLLDVDRTTRVLVVVCYPRVATRGGSAVVNWKKLDEKIN